VLAREEQALDARAGVIAAAVVNTNRGRGQRAVHPGDFFKSLKPSAPKIMTPDEMRDKLRGHFGTK
jgi:hypothetical protein